MIDRDEDFDAQLAESGDDRPGLEDLGDDFVTLDLQAGDPEDDDFGQAGTLVREVFDQDQRDRLVDTVSTILCDGVSEPVLERAFWYWTSIDATVGAAIEARVRGS